MPSRSDPPDKKNILYEMFVAKPTRSSLFPDSWVGPDLNQTRVGPYNPPPEPPKRRMNLKRYKKPDKA